MQAQTSEHKCSHVEVNQVFSFYSSVGCPFRKQADTFLSSRLFSSLSYISLTVFPNSANTSSSSSHELRDVTSVAALQDQAQLTLNKYVATVYPGQQSFRFGKLLLALPPLRAVSGTSIEELFFRKTIGNIAIVRLLSDMYKSSDF